MPTISAPSHTTTAPSAATIVRHMSLASGDLKDPKQAAASRAIAGQSASSALRMIKPTGRCVEGTTTATLSHRTRDRTCISVPPKG